MELYDAIFYRKSTRKYSNKKVKEGLLEEVKNACSQITYLNKELDIKAHVVDRGHLVHFLMGKKCKVKAPHYIIVTSNKGNDYLQNIGFAMEEVVLKLTTLGLATCWLECNIKREDILEFVQLKDSDEEKNDTIVESEEKNEESKNVNLEQPYSIIAFGYPDEDENLNSIEGTYCTDFWCYPMFRSISESMGKPIPVGTMGLLINEKHPALENFPCEFYSTPQWWHIVMNSRLSILDDVKIDPIVQMIDNFERNHLLGLIYEFKVNKSNILVCTSPLKDIKDSREAQWLQYSLIKYIKSDSFKPEKTIDIEMVIKKRM